MNYHLRIYSYATKQQARGFTLVEALVVLLIAGILIAFGVPQFQLVIKNNRVVTATNELVGVINFARIEAIRRGNTVHFGPNTGDPNVGWTVWIDGGDNSPGTGGDNELRVWSAVPDGVTVTLSPANTFYVFNGSGAVDKAVDFTVCDDRAGESGSTITLLLSGALSRTGLVCP